jgi:hypothetical protein
VAEGDGPNLIIRCECGAEFPGDRHGYGQASGHRTNEGHRIVGVIDVDTGDVCPFVPNAIKARFPGFFGEKGERASGGAGSPSGAGGGGRDSGRGGGGSGSRPPSERHVAGRLVRLVNKGGRRVELEAPTEHTFPSQPAREATNLRVRLEGWDVAVPAAAFGLFSLFRDGGACDDDGKPYGWDPDGFSSWLWDVVRHAAEKMLPRLYAGHDPRTQMGVVRLVRSVSGMTDSEIQQIAQMAYAEAAVHGAIVVKGDN